jgi:hypothetical protein
VISHILAIGIIQCIRCALGIAFGGFLVYRVWNIPAERLSRMERWDPMVFLVVGIVSLALAVLRGLQGGFTVRAVRNSRLPRGGRRRTVQGPPVLWATLLGLSLAGIIVLWTAISAGWKPPLPDREALSPARLLLAQALQVVAGAHLALLLAWGAAAAVFLGLLIFRLQGRGLRRFGMAMAVVDLVDLTLFPLTTAAGTYGLIKLGHPEAVDFFEGIYSEKRPAIGDPPFA